MEPNSSGFRSCLVSDPDGANKMTVLVIMMMTMMIISKDVNSYATQQLKEIILAALHRRKTNACKIVQKCK